MFKSRDTNDPFLYSSEEDEDDEGYDCKNCCAPRPEPDNYFMEFLQDASVHGFKFIGQPNQSDFAKIFWVLAIAVGVGVSVYLIMMGVAADMMASPVIMSFQESEITIDRIPFPAVTICTSSKIKFKEYTNLVRNHDESTIKLSEKESLSEEEIRNHNQRFYSLQYIYQLCRENCSFSDHFKKRAPPFEIAPWPSNTTDQESIVGFASEALHKCEDMILLCLWANKPFNCSQEFVPIKTEYGNCCTFNMMPEFVLRKIPRSRLNRTRGNRTHRRLQKITEAWQKWQIDKHLIEKELTPEELKDSDGKVDVPKHQRKSGMSSGLSLLINPGIAFDEGVCDSLDGSGFRVQVHSPIDYPHISDFGKTIAPNSETFVNINAGLTTPDKELEGMSKATRQCYYLGEHKLTSFNFYTQKNCVDECIMNAVYEKCHCVRIYMPRMNQRVCTTVKDYDCINEVILGINENGTQSYCKDCWPSCTQLEYFADTTKLSLRDDVDLWKNASLAENGSSKWTHEKVAIVHLFFSRETVESKARKLLYGTIEILASAGGVIGLTLGISMISFVEPIYYLTIRLLFRDKSTPPNTFSVEDISIQKHSKLNSTKRFVNKVTVQPQPQPQPQPQSNIKNEQLFLTKRIPRAWIKN